MRHRLSLVPIAVLVALLVGAQSVAAANGAVAHVAPKVVLIVGPVGAKTAEYRALADQAASAAAEFTPNVVRVYSPDATWAAVRNALQGASVVVYLGHGNGWPSPYRNALYPPSQNGFGLNPVAGAGDDAHQYFGEDRIATEVQLAPKAIVILSRLCYASGNSEPGIAEGPLDVARQRVDNYAAGFIGAGASAVIAEAHSGPAWYVRKVLSTRDSLEKLWTSAPTAHGHVTRFESSRSPGYVGLLDPDLRTSGFYRSIVLRPDLVTRPGKSGFVQVSASQPEPTLVGTGLALGDPQLRGQTSVGAHSRLRLRYTIDGAGALPDGLRLGIRWDPVSVPDQPSQTRQSRPGPELVAAERLGSIVDPIKATVGKSSIAIPLRLPEVRGTYRLVVTLHDAHGDAYDGASQGLIRQQIVRVTGAVDAAISVQAAFSTTVSSAFELPVAVTNLGVASWGRDAPAGRRPRPGEVSPPPQLVARWIPLDPDQATSSSSDETIPLPQALAPLASARVALGSVAPSRAGQYLLLIDVVTPDDGSLAALGVDPALVRVTVSEPLH